MYTPTIHPWQRVASRLRVPGARRAALQVAGLFVTAAVLAAATPRPAAADHHTLPIAVDFRLLYCVDETGSEGSDRRRPDRHSDDEPYVIMFVADIGARHHPIPSLRLPFVRVFRTSVFENVNDGDIRGELVRLWGLTGSAAPIRNPDDLIMLVSLWDHKTSDVDAIRMEVAANLYRNLRGYMMDGLNRDSIVTRLIENWVAIHWYGARVTTATGRSDWMVGPPQELRPIQNPRNWDDLRRGADLWRVLVFTGWPAASLHTEYVLSFRVHDAVE